MACPAWSPGSGGKRRKMPRSTRTSKLFLILMKYNHLHVPFRSTNVHREEEKEEDLQELSRALRDLTDMASDQGFDKEQELQYLRHIESEKRSEEKRREEHYKRVLQRNADLMK